MFNYNRWHKGSKPQVKIIKQKFFTYRFLVTLLEGYLTKKTNVLDIGCGVGTIDFFMSGKVKKITGIDVSETSIATAKLNRKALNLSKDISFSQMNFPTDTPLGEYNLIICSEVLEHLQDDNLAVKKIYNLLKSGGRIIISVPLKTAPLYELGLLKKFDKRVGHLRRYFPEELVTLLEKEGFKIQKTIKTEGIFRNFLFTFKIGNFPVRLANKFSFVSDAYTVFDNLLGKLFGFSNVYIIAKR